MDELPIGGQITLSPDQVALATEPPVANETPSLKIGESIEVTPEQANQAGQFDPFRDFSAEQLVELQRQNPEFSLVSGYAPRRDLQEVPGMNQKIADAHNLLRRNGNFLDRYRGATNLETAGNVAKGVGETVFDVAKGFGKQLWNYAQSAVTPIAAAVTSPFTTPETTTQMLDIGQRQIAENLAGSELGVSGLVKTVREGAGFLARKVGLSKKLEDYTPEEKVADLFDAINIVKQNQEISSGRGPVLSAVGSEVIKGLEENGVPVRPEEVSELSAGDPFSWYAMGKAFHGATKLIPAPVSASIGRTAEKLGNITTQAVGRGLESAADLTKLGITAAAKVAPLTSAVLGAVKGAELHGPVGLVTGAGLGYKAGQGAAEGLAKVGATAERVSQVGEQVAGKIPITSPSAQLIQDIVSSTPGGAAEFAKGAAFDLGLAAVTSEESPEDRAGIGLGTVFGALGAAKRVGGRALSGQIIGPRGYGITQPVASSGTLPPLDQMHNAAIQRAEPGVAARINALRLFAKGIGNTDVFYADKDSDMESGLRAVGVDPGQAKALSQQEGFFSADVNGRRVIGVRNPSAAPHESFHAFQDVLGEEANQAIDRIVKQEYAPNWEREGYLYAKRLTDSLGKPPGDWRESILDESRWGAMEAADKIARNVFNRISSQTGATPDPAAVKQLAEGEWSRLMADAAKRNPQAPLTEIQKQVWRDVLSPSEAKEVADKYLARELAAENFDAVFKHAGPTLESIPGLVPKFARIVANVVSAMGGEPLAGRTGEISRQPLSFNVTEAVRQAAKQAKPVIEPVKTAAAPAGGGIPATPEAQQAAAGEAKTIADTAPDVKPAPTAQLLNPQSPRELLGLIAEAIAQRTGVKINYLSAPDEPAAATTSNRPARRALIETFRSMPQAARALWEKTFFPERVLKTKGGKYQILGWAPEVFAANAHKVAQALSAIEAAKPRSFTSPYELDPKTKTFTDAGWKALYDDAQTFVKNQIGGRTGAGEKLVVPEGLGAYAPPVSGTASSLDQGKADFINLLFNFRLPDTSRSTGGKVPLNIVGQEVSAATKPGRIEIPIRPRPSFTGEAAQKLGIEGKPILEINPVRNSLEKTAQAAGVPLPSMIEAVQRLNLENIADVQHEPNAPEFRGNTLTLTAGFQPPVVREAREKELKDLFDSSVKLDSSFGEPDTFFDAFVNYLRAEQGRPLSKDYDSSIPGPVKQLGDEIRARYPDIYRLISHRIPALDMVRTGGMQLQPALAGPTGAEAMDHLKAMTPDEMKSYKGNIAGGGTGWAYDAGAAAKTQEDLNAFRQARDLFGELRKDAMANKDFNSAMDLGTRAMLAREAYEAATGVQIDDPTKRAGSLEMIHRTNPDYQPPLAPGKELETQAQPNPEISDLAEEYSKESGITYRPLGAVLPVNPDLEKRIADFYEAAKHAPGNPEVKKSYGALADETIDQYKALINAGYSIEPWLEGGEPYANSEMMMADVKNNKHLFFRPTGEDLSASPDNLMLKPSGIDALTVNDIFRAVHDIFGHAKESLSFGPKGEYNAWRAHSGMYSDEAQGALAAETLAQNSWVNFGPHLRNEKNEIPGKGQPGYKEGLARPFAEQKNVIIPQSLISEATRNQLQPKTEAGKTLEKRGYKIEREEFGTGLQNYFISRDNEIVAELTAKQISPDKANVDLVSVIDSHAKKGLAETLYRELASDLQKKGVTRLTGYVVHPAPAKIRNKLFGSKLNVNNFPTGDLENVSPEDKEFLSEGPSGQSVESHVSPTAQFQPGAEEEGIDYGSYRSTLGGLYRGAAWISPKGYRIPAPEGHQKAAFEYLGTNIHTATTAPYDEMFSKKMARVSVAPDAIHVEAPGFALTKAQRATLEEDAFKADKPVFINGKASDIGPASGAQLQPPRPGENIDSYFEIGHGANPGDRTWVWNPSTADIADAPGKFSHTSAFGEESLAAFRGRFDKEQNKVSVAFPDRVRNRLDHEPTEDDVPNRIYKALKDKYGPDVKIVAFQPKEEWELRPAASGFSKAWILPTGQPVQLGSQWHHDYLNENAALRKEYGLKETDDQQKSRTDALKKGFARVNYDSRNGRLTVEARESDWPGIAPSVRRLIEQNLGKIDSVQTYLFNRNVSKVSDSGVGNLFDKSGKEAKIAAVPFIGISGEVTETSPQATPGALGEQAVPGTVPTRRVQFQAPSKEELDKIRSGKSGGQTFNTNGEIWEPKDKAVDLVSLASVNLPQGELTPEAFQKAVAPYEDLLQEPGIVAGVYSFSKDGKPTISIDINGAVPQEHRANTLQFAKDNDQESIWDVKKGETVPTGGKGNTKLTLPGEILDAFDSLVKGNSVPIDDILTQHRTPGETATQESLFGGKAPLSNMTLANMTKAELAKHYPEAVISRRKFEPIPSDIKNSPLAQTAGSESEAIDAFARRLVEFANEYKDNPIFQQGKRWYSEFSPQLRKEFGDKADIMAELLAATSPRTDVQSNFAYALDALEGLKAGRFTKILPKYEEGLRKLESNEWESWYNREMKAGRVENPPAEATPAAFLAHWISKFNLKPLQSNGKLFGTHSVRVLQVIARRWNDLNTGLKTRTFVSNLLGTVHDATVDVWADRTMRRLGYFGFKERWRILPSNTAPVSDADFSFSQKAFAKAAENLGMKPDALQGALWFAEKQHWADNGWARLDLGSFQKEMQKIPMLRRGIEQRTKVETAGKQSKIEEPMELNLVTPRFKQTPVMEGGYNRLGKTIFEEEI